MCQPLLTYGSGKAKVTEFHNSPLGDEDVFWFYITVDNLSKLMDGGKREEWKEVKEQMFEGDPLVCMVHVGCEIR